MQVLRNAIFTVDVESSYLDAEKGVYDYLRLFSNVGIRATFFVVGEVAEKYPSLVRSILADGHEVGSHAYRHPRVDIPIKFKSPFLDELKRLDLVQHLESSKKVLEECGAKVVGFRAPSFRTNSSVIEEISKLFLYDSSLSGQANKFTVLPNGLFELPVTTFARGYAKAGTPYYFGFIPQTLFEYLLYVSSNDPLVFYGHSFDFICTSSRIYTSFLKYYWYYKDCGPDRIQDVRRLIMSALKRGIRYITAQEYITKKN
jgi:hypothetical protein